MTATAIVSQIQDELDELIAEGVPVAVGAEYVAAMEAKGKTVDLTTGRPIDPIVLVVDIEAQEVAKVA